MATEQTTREELDARIEELVQGVLNGFGESASESELRDLAYNAIREVLLKGDEDGSPGVEEQLDDTIDIWLQYGYSSDNIPATVPQEESPRSNMPRPDNNIRAWIPAGFMCYDGDDGRLHVRIPEHIGDEKAQEVIDRIEAHSYRITGERGYIVGYYPYTTPKQMLHPNHA